MTALFLSEGFLFFGDRATWHVLGRKVIIIENSNIKKELRGKIVSSLAPLCYLTKKANEGKERKERERGALFSPAPFSIFLSSFPCIENWSKNTEKKRIKKEGLRKEGSGLEEGKIELKKKY